jgi:hypothetical protein
MARTRQTRGNTFFSILFLYFDSLQQHVSVSIPAYLAIKSKYSFETHLVSLGRIVPPDVSEELTSDDRSLPQVWRRLEA